ncbi:DNA mismatch repair endonuclease MutL [Vibrio algivorus]|uniref:DNA mismatch repair protein MutL n=1 Tax=Vibrio algivorus TaxID=1667024 RepID=A0ABQ6EKC6_9VIBR|nr:DNA mismatch repair endonuclease MutL [Vibrio algivorus]GLT13216.1 DNA mismatch repair protein MutL [Vibrio algivorus]
MAIKILPARLANQIAAGEVVERPASVVKELVENSIDSGATRIDVDIEKGGSKLIRVRDNGSGIEKDELGLALSRHATSKIHSLDDLEAILSLGFRGEALASISSVSRLTLTSRTATQAEAWAAYAEGRDMAVQLTPAAHPIGTTVEVVDLFFNTPARRKFLRTEKTEFSHIDELLKRIALSCFSVSITLRHNGKVIRQYRSAKTELQIEKRVAAVCGNNFMEHAVSIELKHDDLKLKGWITTPDGARSQSDLQYCYVNGRMMRDKLINHAIRQSYENALRPEQFATYVLFIEVDPHQVDVNVHPAKHEVRFHHARLVHDFIYQALSDALAQSIEIVKPSISKSAYATEPVGSDDYSIRESAPVHQPQHTRSNSSASTQAWDSSRVSSGHSRSSSPTSYPSSRPSSVVQKKQTDAYRALFEPLASVVDKSNEELELDASHQEADTAIAPASGLYDSTHESSETSITNLGKALTVIQDVYLLMQNEQGCHLVDLNKAEALRVQGQFNLINGDMLKAQPLLIPLNIPMSAGDIETLTTYQKRLLTLGIELKAKGKSSVMVMGVPQPLRQQNLQQLIPDLLAELQKEQNIELPLITQWLTSKIVVAKPKYSLSEAIQLVAELEQIWGAYLPYHQYNWIQPVNFSESIAALQS